MIDLRIGAVFRRKLLHTTLMILSLAVSTTTGRADSFSFNPTEPSGEIRPIPAQVAQIPLPAPSLPAPASSPTSPPPDGGPGANKSGDICDEYPELPQCKGDPPESHKPDAGDRPDDACKYNNDPRCQLDANGGTSRDVPQPSQSFCDRNFFLCLVAGIGAVAIAVGVAILARKSAQGISAPNVQAPCPITLSTRAIDCKLIQNLH